MPLFKHEGIDFNYEIQGEGIPFLFLHGLGDNLKFAFETFNNDEKSINFIGSKRSWEKRT